jgi:hypothetical protein
VAGGYSLELDRRVYAGIPVAYDTTNAPTFGATLTYAVPIGAPGGPKP